MTKQYQALLATESVTLKFEDSAIDRLAELAFQLNESQENIGARRLSTVLERLLDKISFAAPDQGGTTITMDASAVDREIGELAGNPDLSRYIL